MKSLRIKELRLRGFKSYKSKCIVGPLDDKLNVFCGPNGSGKSALLEAICFVLGVTSTQLRARNQRALVNEEVAAQQGTCLCRVTLRCEVVAQDNSIKEYVHLRRSINKRGESQWTITRIQLESNTGRKEKQIIKHSELKKLLAEWNVDMTFSERFIIDQTNTIQLVQKDNVSMLEFLEELIGTRQYKEMIEKEDNEIRNIFKNLSDLRKSQVNFEKEQQKLFPVVSIYKSYKDAHTEWQKLELNFLKKHYALKALELCKTETERNAVSLNIRELTENRLEMQRKIASTKEKIDQSSEELKKWQEKESNIYQQLETGREDELRLTTRITKLEQDLVASENEITSIQNEINSVQCSLKEITREFEEKTKKAEELTQTHRMLTIEKNDMEKELESNLPDATHQLRLLQQKLAFFERHQTHTSITAPPENQNNEEIKKYVQDLKEQLLDREKLYCDYKTKWETSTKEQSNVRTTIEEINKEIEHSLQKQQLLENTLAHHRTQLRSLQSHLRKLMAQRNMTTFEKAIRELQKNSSICVFGMLKDLLFVTQAKYLQAVNSVLRPYFHHTVVVKTREDAKKVVAYFNQHKIGIVSCEIVSELQDDTTPLNQDQGPASLQWVPQLIACNDSTLRPLVLKLSGKWWLADTREVAASLSFNTKTQCRRNIVTLRGEMYYSHGEITLTKTMNTSYELSAGQCPVSAPIALTENENMSALQEEEKHMQQQIVQIETELNDVIMKIESLRAILKTKESELTNLMEKSEELHSALFELETILKKNREALRSVESRLQQHHCEIQTTDNTTGKCDKIRQKLAIHLQQYPQMKPFVDVEQKLRTVASKVAEEEQTIKSLAKKQIHFKDTLAKKTSRIEFLQNQIGILREKLTKFRSETKRKVKQNQKIEKQHKSMTNTIQKLEDSLTELQKDHEEYEKKSKECETELTTLNEKFEHLENELGIIKSTKEQIETQLLQKSSSLNTSCSKSFHLKSISTKKFIFLGQENRQTSAENAANKI